MIGVNRMLGRFIIALLVGVVFGFAPDARANTPADTLVIAKNIDDMITLDPAEAYEFTGIEVIANMYDRIMRFEPTDITKLVPGVAESCDVSDDGKTFTFKIRPNQKFASGNPVTAEDAAYSLQRVIKLDKNPAFLITQLGWNKDNVDQLVRAVDPMTLQIKITEDFSPSLVLSLMSSVVGSVVDMKMIMQHEADGDMGLAWLRTHSAGSGAYVLKGWKADVSVVLDANPNYRGGVAALKRVVIRHVVEPASQRLLIEKGDVDIARDIAPNQIKGVADNTEVAATTVPQESLYYVGLNLKTVPFQNIKVRQAMHYLVDYQGMVNSFLEGNKKVHQTFWPSGLWASLDENEYTFDPAKAKALLVEAGYPDGFEVTLDSPNSSPFSNMAQSIQATMAQGGIKVNIILGEQKTVLTKYRARQHQMLLINWGPDYMDPHTNADFFARNPDNSDEAKSKTLAWRNSWEIPDITAMTNAAVREHDTAKREEMYKVLQRRVMDEGPFIIMFQETKQLASRANVKNFIMGPSSDVVYYNLTTK
jgi:peptide/nickel transport system substrate-binding protein